MASWTTESSFQERLTYSFSGVWGDAPTRTRRDSTDEENWPCVASVYTLAMLATPPPSLSHIIPFSTVPSSPAEDFSRVGSLRGAPISRNYRNPSSIFGKDIRFTLRLQQDRIPDSSWSHSRSFLSVRDSFSGNHTTFKVGKALSWLNKNPC